MNVHTDGFLIALGIGGHSVDGNLFQNLLCGDLTGCGDGSKGCIFRIQGPSDLAGEGGLQSHGLTGSQFDSLQVIQLLLCLQQEVIVGDQLLLGLIQGIVGFTGILDAVFLFQIHRQGDGVNQVDCGVDLLQGLLRQDFCGQDEGLGAAISGTVIESCIQFDCRGSVNQIERNRFTGCHRSTIELCSHLCDPVCKISIVCDCKAHGCIFCRAGSQRNIAGIAVPDVADHLCASEGNRIHIGAASAAPAGAVNTVGIDRSGDTHVRSDLRHTFHGDHQVFPDIFDGVFAVSAGNGLAVHQDNHILAIVAGGHSDGEGIAFTLSNGERTTGDSVALAGGQGGIVAAVAAGSGVDEDIRQDRQHTGYAAGVGIDFLTGNIGGGAVGTGIAAEAADLNGTIGQGVGAFIPVGGNGDGELLQILIAAEVVDTIGAACFADLGTIRTIVVEAEVGIIHAGQLLHGGNQIVELNSQGLTGLGRVAAADHIAVAVQHLEGDLSCTDNLVGSLAVLLHLNDMGTGG